MLSGSSGGFVNGWTLVETNAGREAVGGEPGLQLASNYAVQWYFTACYLASRMDEPDSYRPCSFGWTRVRHPSRAQGSASLVFDLLDPAGRILSSFAERRPAGLIGGQWVSCRQLPLYERPNQPIAPGKYTRPQPHLSSGAIRDRLSGSAVVLILGQFLGA
jgi:hypothetical protein